MMATIPAVDLSRYDAFARLLATPDPKDLPRRARVLRCAGDPDRLGTRLPLIVMGWVQHRCLEIAGEAPLSPAITTVKSRPRESAPVLRVLRPKVAARA